MFSSCTYRKAPSAYHALLFLACNDMRLTRIFALSAFVVPACHVQRVCVCVCVSIFYSVSRFVFFSPSTFAWDGDVALLFP